MQFISESIDLVLERFDSINSSDDFLGSKEGLMRLDAISMRLQSIGEALKNIDKREHDFLLHAADKEYWKQIIRTRDFIPHHYIDLDSEIIFEICQNELLPLRKKIFKLQSLLKNNSAY